MNKPDDVTRPNYEELLAWAADLRQKYRRGELNQGQIDALEKTPGWTWDIDEAKRLGI